MTTLLDRAVAELKKRPDHEQDLVARDILARIGEPLAREQATVLGRGRAVMSFADPNDAMIDILTAEDVAEWYREQHPANP